MRRPARRQYTSPEGGERDRETYLAAIDNIVYGEDPSEGFVRGRRFLHPKLGFTFQAPDTFTLDNSAQAVIGVREGGTPGDALRRGAGAGRTVARRLPQFRLDGRRRSPRPRTSPSTVFRRQQRPRMAIAGSSRSMRCASVPTSTASSLPPSKEHRERTQRAGDRQLVPPPDLGRDSGRPSAAHQGHHRTAPATPWDRWPACPASTARRTGSGFSTASTPTPRSRRAIA